MALTVSSYVFACERAIAEEIAKLAGLRHEDFCHEYDYWEDRQTGGGGCRIVWAGGVAWITRHSGYAWADMTEKVAFFFEHEYHCKPYDDPHMWHNPNIYGWDRWEWYKGEHVLPKDKQPK
jgi:hypothetical protein